MLPRENCGLTQVGTPLVCLLLIGAVVLAAAILHNQDDPVADAKAPSPPPASEPPPALPPEPPPEPQPPAVASLTGRLEGDRCPGAWVALVGAPEEMRAFLDDEGTFQFPEAPANLTLSLWLGPDPSGTRVENLFGPLVLKPGERRTVTLSPARRSAVHGLVTDTVGRPLSGVRVAALHPDADWRTAVPVAAVTGQDGRFYVAIGKEARRGPLRLVVDHVAEGFVLEERIVAAGEIGVDEVVKLEKGLAIAGRVVGPQGRPIPDAEVHILEDYRGDEELRRPVEGLVRTDEEGRFHDDAYRPGIYRIFASGTFDGSRFAAVMEGVSGGDLRVEVGFPGFGSFGVSIHDEGTGEKLDVRSVRLERIYGHTGEAESFGIWEERAEVGEATFDRLPEGHYRLLLRHPGYRVFRSDLLFIAAGKDLGRIRYTLTPLAR